MITTITSRETVLFGFIERLEAEKRELLEALKRIARPHDCGCVPCMGACRCPEAEEITSDGMRDIADAAIANATKGDKHEGFSTTPA